jgi:hypothetical protein
MTDKPRAWMRRWAFEGIKVMKLPKADRPPHWIYAEVTVSKLFEDDVPLFAKEEQQ